MHLGFTHSTERYREWSSRDHQEQSPLARKGNTFDNFTFATLLYSTSWFIFTIQIIISLCGRCLNNNNSDITVTFQLKLLIEVHSLNTHFNAFPLCVCQCNGAFADGGPSYSLAGGSVQRPPKPLWGHLRPKEDCRESPGHRSCPIPPRSGVCVCVIRKKITRGRR